MTPTRSETGGPNAFFFAGEPESRPRRRMLLVSYYYQPINVVGAHRWQKLSWYAAERGWALDVLLVDPDSTSAPDHPASGAVIDMDQLNDLPRGTTLYTVRDQGSRLYDLQRRLWRAIRPLARRGRAPASTPAEIPVATDAPVKPSRGAAYLAWLHFHELFHWSRQAAAVAIQIAGRRRPDVIVSSAPPHSTHEAARLISAATRIPWVMDMRDPWSSPEVMPREYAGPTWLRLAARYEARCVRSASLVSVTTEALRNDLRQRYPELTARFLTAMNGADPRAMTNDAANPVFTIAYAGNLYVGRDPRNLFRAVGRVVQELSLTPADLRVEFMGGADFMGKPIGDIAAETGAAGFVSALPAQPHQAALEFLARASMLVSLPQYAHLAIPAKLFEYVQYNAWLLVLAQRESATELLFRDSAADVVEPGDVERIASAIRRRFEQHRRGERAMPVNHDGRFDRSRQAAILLDAIEGVCSRPSPR